MYEAAEMITLKRAYDPRARSDGPRILVERLWPRGISKADLRIDHWPKALAPSHELRRWFDHERERWSEFKERYFAELANQPKDVALLVSHSRAGDVTFVFAARETRFNNAVALKEYIDRLT